MPTPNPWIVELSGSPEAEATLLCLPYAGGGIASLRAFTDSIAPTIRCLGVRYPGRESRIREPPIANAQSLADNIYTAIEPYIGSRMALFGYSMGAIVAYEVALRMQRNGHPPEHLFFAARQPPHLPNAYPPIYALERSQMLKALAEWFDLPDQLIQSEELIDLVEPMLRADFAVCDTYRTADTPTVNATFTIIGGVKDRAVPASQLTEWDRYTNQRPEVTLLDARHMFLDSHADQLAELIANKLGVARSLNPDV